MIGKPFQPPLLNRRPSGPAPPQHRPPSGFVTEPPAKRRRISFDTAHEPTKVVPVPQTNYFKPAQVFRKPLLSVKNPSTAASLAEEAATGGDGIEGYYTVLHRKFTSKKHKTWDGDGVLSIYDGYAHLQDEDGRQMGKTMWKAPLLPGSTLSIGGRDVEIDSVMTREVFLRGRAFLASAVKEVKQEPGKASESSVSKQGKNGDEFEDKEDVPIKKCVASSTAIKTGFKNPLIASTLMPKTNGPLPQPRHDPNAPGALVMKRPKSAPKGKQIVDVVVDPFLGKHLREHQRVGVQFMYECVMGLRPFEGEGAILADEMGLGKTLQTIALLWTLLKQNPVHGERPVVKKALIICPAGLINNWRKEFRKWLGNERIGVFVVEDKKKARLTDFTKGKSYNVMVVGYEMFLAIQQDLKKGGGIDIVVADEGHRLKTAKNKSGLAIKALNTNRVVVLSGTPIQNDLSEFFFTVDLVNPGMLGKYSTFKREFETPIVRGRQPEATAKEVEKGDARQKELDEITDQFMLRRKADILAKYLPPKAEYVLFCRPTAAQASVYRSVIASPLFGSVLNNSESSLQLINILKKVCNSPSLLTSKSDETPTNSTVSSLLADVPASILKGSPASSTKLQVLDSLLHRLRTTTDEKIVLVSNYTATLDMLGQLLTALSYTFLRLDGSTPASKRQALVDRFNTASANNIFAFLLSAKAGGTGLNLIGASRLVLFDVDWNPSTDLQAMARIHRDGQTRPCWIYRMVVAGALDEKIYWRQVVKTGLSEAVVDGKKNSSSFSGAELRDLFRLEEGVACPTHELLGCHCGGRGVLPVDDEEMSDAALDADDDEDLPELGTLMKASQVDMAEQERRIEEAGKAKKGKGKARALMQYLHLDTALLNRGDEEAEQMEALVEDKVLCEVLKEEGGRVGYVFAKIK